MTILVPELTELVYLGWRPLAYLDPGSGSYLLQLLIAAVMGALLMLRVYWGRVKSFVQRLMGISNPDEGEDQTD